MGGRREREAKGEGRPGRRGPVARLLQCGFFFFFCRELFAAPLREGAGRRGVGAAGDKPRGAAALPAAHCCSAAATRAAGTAGAPPPPPCVLLFCTPTSRRPRRLAGGPARTLAPAPETRAPWAPPGTRWGRPGAGAPHPGHVSARRPVRSSAFRRKPPDPGARVPAGRRVCNSRALGASSLSRGSPPHRECSTTSAHSRVLNLALGEKMGPRGPHHPYSLPGAPALGRCGKRGQEGPRNFHVHAFFPSGQWGRRGADSGLTS